MEEHFCGGGAGIAWVDSMETRLVIDHSMKDCNHKQNEIMVFFKGSLANNPTDMEDAEYLMEEYKNWSQELSSFWSGDSESQLNLLHDLQGPYAFIIYDKREDGRIMASRDAKGLEPLFLGTNSDVLFFASDENLIEGDCSDVQDFPPGHVFISDPASTVGKLYNTIDSGTGGCLKVGDLFSESANNLNGMLESC